MKQTINGLDLQKMIESGMASLKSDEERINALNVFPVPDGDTGTNMRMTVEGGVKIGSTLNDKNIGTFSKAISRAMVMSARGNSGVITSQFFKGISLYFENKEDANVEDLAHAMCSGTEKCYKVVSNPTEGTMLTVMREAGQKSLDNLDKFKNFDDYFKFYLDEANASLLRTPDLLPVLKKAGVIDSGGAGFIKIIEGMYDQITENKENKAHESHTSSTDSNYKYNVEIILQLDECNTNNKSFDENNILNLLNVLGDSTTCNKENNLLSINVNTSDPGVVLTLIQKYGDFISVQINNVSSNDINKTFNNENENKPVREHKRFGLVAVANGSGISETFKDLGVDEIVSGGQTMNSSTQDFVDAFNKIDADYILVYPNNSNIKMAAQSAADNYDKAKVYVLPTKTIAEGYSAISMLELDSDNIDTVLEIEKEAINNVSSLEVTYSIRDCVLNNIEVKKNDFICLYDGELISCNKSRIEAVKQAFSKIPDFADKQVLTIIYGNDVNTDESSVIENAAKSLNKFIEACPVNGGQDVYSYIIGIE